MLLEHEGHERARRIELAPERVSATRRQELGGILALGKDDTENLKRGLVHELDGSLGGALPRLVAVEHADDAPPRKASDHLDMVEREGRAEGGNGVLDARLVHRDDIRIALADNGAVLAHHGVLGTIEGKEMLTLAKDGRILGVEVLGLGVGEHAPAKADGATLLVIDGKHRTVKEAVPKASPAPEGEICRKDLLITEALVTQVRDEPAASRSKAQVPATADGRAEAAPRQVTTGGARPLPPVSHEGEGVVVPCRRDALDEAVSPRPTTGTPLLRKFDPRPIRQVADGVGEVEALAPHHIGKDVATGTAAEALPEAGRGYDVKRRALLMVEGAAAPKVMAALPELDRLANELEEIGRLADLLLVLVRDHTVTSTPLSPSLARTQSMLARTARSSSSIESKRLDARSQEAKRTLTSAP